MTLKFFKNSKYSKNQRKNILMLGGGTAGHMFPIQALVESFQDHNCEYNIFLITDQGSIWRLQKWKKKYLF